MNPKELVAQFIEEKLKGDISRLATFPLGNLRNDKVYGCPGRNFDSDDTELMDAAEKVLREEKFPEVKRL